MAIGGSASTDGGVGLLSALGVRFLDAAGDPVRPGARSLSDIAHVDPSGLVSLPPDGLHVWSDVTNPLTGLDGAAAVYGPQKGLAAESVPLVDEGLRRFARFLGTSTSTPGAGAAGGVGYALSWLGARMRRGATEVARIMRLSEHLDDAQLVITGEGRFDGQSMRGKAVSEVTERAHNHGVPVALVAGAIDRDADLASFDTALALSDLAGPGEDPIRDAAELLERAGTVLATSCGAPARH